MHAGDARLPEFGDEAGYEARSPAPPAAALVHVHVEMRRELAEQLAAAVASLGPKHREAFVLVVQQRVKYRDAAEVLGVPEGTVKSRVAYAERELRAKLRKYLTL